MEKENKILLYFIFLSLPIYLFCTFKFLFYFDTLGFIFTYVLSVFYFLCFNYYKKYIETWNRETIIRNIIRKEICTYLEKRELENIDHYEYRKIKNYFKYLFNDITKIYVDNFILNDYYDISFKLNNKIKEYICSRVRNNNNMFDFRIESNCIVIYLGKNKFLEKEIDYKDEEDLTLDTFYSLEGEDKDLLNKKLYTIN